MVYSKITARLLSERFSLPIGGREPNRIEVVPGYYYKTDENIYHHSWVALYLDNEAALYIDPSYWQFNPQYKELIIVAPYQLIHNKFGLREGRAIFREQIDAWIRQRSLKMNTEEAIVFLENSMADRGFSLEEAEILTELSIFRKDEKIRSGSLIDFGAKTEAKITQVVRALAGDTQKSASVSTPMFNPYAGIFLFIALPI
ncbi:MAG: hypothetical protein WC417_07220, partial [Candidatus Omnitrophota bacterium]